MNRLPPAQLLQVARDERTRRKAARARTGKGGAEQAYYDDLKWSCIEDFARALTDSRHRPRSWHPEDMADMVASVRATYRKALEACDRNLDLRPKAIGLRDLLYAMECTLLYTMQHPVPANPSSSIFGAAA